MKRNILLLLLFGFSLMNHSQSAKAAQNKKGGSAKVTKVTPDPNMANDEAKITFTFVGPDNKPAKSHIKVVCNNDSAWPVIDDAGHYTVEVDPRKYKMRFSVPFWQEIKTDSILCKKKTVTNILIKFESQEFKSGH